jgi:hypothetical protein
MGVFAPNSELKSQVMTATAVRCRAMRRSRI